MGTVGQGVWRHLEEGKDAMQRRFGAEFELAKACVRDIARKRSVYIPAEKLTTNPLDILDDPEIDIVCELMGGTDAAFEHTMRAIKNGKSVVSANKAVICMKGAEIFEAASAAKVGYFYEASVAGGIPVIKIIKEGLVANRFTSIYGILNGTCNYILTRMEKEEASFESILKDARKLGYVEEDESLDIDGWDAAHKAVVLAHLAHGKWVSLDDMIVTGIRDIRLEDMLWAREFDYRIKLIASVKCRFDTKKLSVSVYPALVPLSDVVANVNGVYNAVSIQGDVVGRTVHIGRGAGQDATASAVISDIADSIKYLRGAPSDAPKYDSYSLDIARLEEMRNSFYLRLCVKDEAGVLAQITAIFAHVGVSIELLKQVKHPKEGKAWLVLTTHETDEGAVETLRKQLEDSKAVLGSPFVLRILRNKE